MRRPSSLECLCYMWTSAVRKLAHTTRSSGIALLATTLPVFACVSTVGAQDVYSWIGDMNACQLAALSAAVLLACLSECAIHRSVLTPTTLLAAGVAIWAAVCTRSDAFVGAVCLYGLQRVALHAQLTKRALHTSTQLRTHCLVLAIAMLSYGSLSVASAADSSTTAVSQRIQIFVLLCDRVLCIAAPWTTAPCAPCQALPVRTQNAVFHVRP